MTDKLKKYFQQPDKKSSNEKGLERKPKNRELATGLAVFLGLLTWIYTWKEDYWKFLVGLLLCLISSSLIGIFWWSFLVPIGVWVWAITDTVRKNDKWYEEY